jgi:phosphatidylserine decarboxylase
MIHKEGYRISIMLFVILVILNTTIVLFTGAHTWVEVPVIIASLLLLLFILRFFRDPKRTIPVEGFVYAPADGKVVVIEKTIESEYFNEERIQVSIFMSAWNVHINWYPVAGNQSYYKYHPGKYLLARHPKSSTLNERNTLVIKTTGGTEIMIRQIAGIVARRIISYATQGKNVKLGDEMGFIRFGSRVDIFLPVGTEILVKPGQRVRGLITALANSGF